MSQEGRTKKREREEETAALIHNDDGDSAGTFRVPAATFFNMPDVVHGHVSPYLTAWSDHRALACTTPGLWRYYQRHDHSTQIMFLLHHHHHQRVVSATRRTRDILLRESGDIRCIEWLWNQKKSKARATDLAVSFCKTAARCGHAEVLLRFAPYVEKVYQHSLIRKSFATLCKHGRDEAAVTLLRSPLVVATAGNAATAAFEWTKYVIIAAGHLQRIPKTREFLWLLMSQGIYNWTEEHFLLTCLFNSCTTARGYDIDDGFTWIWAQCLARGMGEKWLASSFLEDLMTQMATDMFSPAQTSVLRRLPAIVRRFFADMCFVETELITRAEVWRLHHQHNQTITIKLFPPDELDEQMVLFIFQRPDLRASRNLKLPANCTR